MTNFYFENHVNMMDVSRHKKVVMTISQKWLSLIFFSKINPYYTKQCDIGSFYGKQTQRILKMGPFLLYAQHNSVKPLLKPAQKNGI